MPRKFEGAFWSSNGIHTHTHTKKNHLSLVLKQLVAANCLVRSKDTFLLNSKSNLHSPKIGQHECMHVVGKTEVPRKISLCWIKAFNHTEQSILL